jgi:hypothetical protein
LQTHAGARVYQEPADRGKDDADEDEQGDHGLRSEDWLPSLETLLLEGGVWRRRGPRLSVDSRVRAVLSARMHLQARARHAKQ